MDFCENQITWVPSVGREIVRNLLENPRNERSGVVAFQRMSGNYLTPPSLRDRVRQRASVGVTIYLGGLC